MQRWSPPRPRLHTMVSHSTQGNLEQIPEPTRSLSALCSPSPILPTSPARCQASFFIQLTGSQPQKRPLGGSSLGDRLHLCF